MIWFLYNILAVIGMLFALPGFVKRAVKRGGAARGFSSRLGHYSSERRAAIGLRPRIWIHAVSVGEMYVALRLAEELRSRDSTVAFFMTTTTSTGHAVAARELHDDDVLSYFPVDLPMVVRHVLDVVRPRAIVLVELELWPNLIRLAAARGIPVALVNGRITEQSARAYRWVRVFFERGIKLVNVLCVQTRADHDRLVALGAEPSKMRIVGTAKYDAVTETGDAPPAGEEIFRDAGIEQGDLALVGGSTWPGEETALLDAYLSLRSDFNALKLVLAPRHVERAGEISDEVRRRGLKLRLRSETAETGAPPDVLLLDTTGELRTLYAYSTIIFVGKSLTAHGGHSVIEPAAYGKAIIVGPHTENFAEVVNDFRDAEGLIEVASAAELESTIRLLLEEEGLRIALGERAQRLVKEKQGVVATTADEIFGVMAG